MCEWRACTDGKHGPSLFSLKCHNCKKGFITHQSERSCTSRNSHRAWEMRPLHQTAEVITTVLFRSPHCLQRGGIGGRKMEEQNEQEGKRGQRVSSVCIKAANVTYFWWQISFFTSLSSSTAFSGFFFYYQQTKQYLKPRVQRTAWTSSWITVYS